jgi:hypothetical protein
MVRARTIQSAHKRRKTMPINNIIEELKSGVQPFWMVPAGGESTLVLMILLGCRVVLVSYQVLRGWSDQAIEDFFRQCREANVLVIVDSGAWALYSRGRKVSISIRAYAKWLKKWGPHIWMAVNLDYIRNPRKTWRSMRFLEDEGVDQHVRLMTVYHQFEPIDVLLEMMEMYRYVGISPEGKKSNNPNPQRRWFLYEVLPFLEPHKWYHIYGLGSPRVLKDVVLRVDTSCLITADARSWAIYAEFGSLILPSGDRISVADKWVPPDHYTLMSSMEQALVGQMLQDAGFTWEDVLGREPVKCGNRKRFNGHSLVLFQNHLNALRRENPSPWKPDPFDDTSSEKFD